MSIMDSSRIGSLTMFQSKFPDGLVASFVELEVDDIRACSARLSRTDILSIALWMVKASKKCEKMDGDDPREFKLRFLVDHLKHELEPC